MDLLDTASARVKIGRATKPEAVDQIERRMYAIDKERLALAGDSRMSAGSADQSDRIAELDAEYVKLEGQKKDSSTPRARRPSWTKCSRCAKLDAAAKGEGEAPSQAELDAALAKLNEVQGDSPLVPLDVDARLVGRSSRAGPASR